MARTEEFDRELVLEKAMNLFWEKGYNGTSMQDLVDRTGLNRSSLYNSFGSKMDLYEETLKSYQKQTGGIFQKALLKAKDPLDAIQQIFESFLPEILGDKQERGCFILNCKMEMSNQDASVKKWLLDTQENQLSTFQELVSEGQKQGLINNKEDSMSYAYYILSAFQGFRITGILVKKEEVLRQLIHNVISVLK
ncbi:TetR/AcrR family transcriptional regulator [Poritiphilus flavus]|uniref:TetR family transcriptional regulator n=1 Tax=Poritiphilus flavus TaxID=2697053 RepID=A0A6L9E7R1_9FLAO|nr:TetR/AcrR family transcriptional regulator [Poritiphilus flavus]NAS10767.1 TetR family transcriptional regulator [Poritiphilus flavus]